MRRGQPPRKIVSGRREGQARGSRQPRELQAQIAEPGVVVPGVLGVGAVAVLVNLRDRRNVHVMRVLPRGDAERQHRGSDDPGASVAGELRHRLLSYNNSSDAGDRRFHKVCGAADNRLAR